MGRMEVPTTNRKPKSRRRAKFRKPRTYLRLPDLEHAKNAVLNRLSSQESKRGYAHTIDEFVDWYCSEPRLAFNRVVVLRYKSYLESQCLAAGTINLRFGAVRRLAYKWAEEARHSAWKLVNRGSRQGTVPGTRFRSHEV